MDTCVRSMKRKNHECRGDTVRRFEKDARVDASPDVRVTRVRERTPCSLGGTDTQIDRKVRGETEEKAVALFNVVAHGNHEAD